MTGDEYMQVMWTEMRDHGKPALNEGHAVVRGFVALGIFSPDQGELWDRRIETCPGHDDEGGRDWCAYCGTMRRFTEAGK